MWASLPLPGPVEPCRCRRRVRNRFQSCRQRWRPNSTGGHRASKWDSRFLPFKRVRIPSCAPTPPPENHPYLDSSDECRCATRFRSGETVPGSSSEADVTNAFLVGHAKAQAVSSGRALTSSPSCKAMSLSDTSKSPLPLTPKMPSTTGTSGPVIASLRRQWHRDICRCRARKSGGRSEVSVRRRVFTIKLIGLQIGDRNLRCGMGQDRKEETALSPESGVEMRGWFPSPCPAWWVSGSQGRT